jgi:phospholipid/cholesterol/gamma-HCH transport system permease protein
MADDKHNSSTKTHSAESGEVDAASAPKDILRIRIKGNWKIGEKQPSASLVQKKIESVGTIRRVGFYTVNMGEWDSSLLTFLTKISDYCTENDLTFDKDGLPQGVQRLIALATAVPER